MIQVTTNEPDTQHYKLTLGLPMDFAGDYDIPCIDGITFDDLDSIDMIGFNYATNPKADTSKYIHFYLGDYKIERFWRDPDKYINVLKRFKGIVLPDFSMYTNMPRAMQIWNHYRNMWLGAYAQLNGIKVIPSLTWSDEHSFEYCFDGMPKHSCLCVLTVGCVKNPDVRKRFYEGFCEAVGVLEPFQIIVYGRELPGMWGSFKVPYTVIMDDMQKRIKGE